MKLSTESWAKWWQQLQVRKRTVFCFMILIALMLVRCRLWYPLNEVLICNKQDIPDFIDWRSLSSTQSCYVKWIQRLEPKWLYIITAKNLLCLSYKWAISALIQWHSTAIKVATVTHTVSTKDFCLNSSYQNCSLQIWAPPHGMILEIWCELTLNRIVETWYRMRAPWLLGSIQFEQEYE
jgi:hypothetical protein